MTAEQLEGLLGKVTQGGWCYYITTKRVFAKCEHPRNIADLRYTNGDYDGQLMALAPSLARRVIAAEKLVEALEAFQECDCKRYNCATCAWFSDAEAAITAYREASK